MSAAITIGLIPDIEMAKRLGLTAFALLVREPELPTMRPKVRIAEHLRDFPMLLKGDPNFLHFMIARTFPIANRVAAPFYIVYASQNVSLSGSTIGVLSFGGEHYGGSRAPPRRVHSNES